MRYQIRHAIVKYAADTILEDVNFEIHDHEKIAIIGRNGCGKTMLFRTICGFVKPAAGEIIVDNLRIGKDIEYIRNTGASIGESDFLRHLSGYENLKLLAEINNKITDEEILSVLKKVNLFEEKDKKFKKYSVGMKQKLRIAQAIMEEPEILILDEPFNGVDRESVLKIREYLNDLKKQNKTVLLASHMSEDLQVLCDHIFKMELGRIIDENI